MLWWNAHGTCGFQNAVTQDDLEPDEIAIQIRELQKALANAKREQMAMIFGIVINSAFDEHSFTSAAFAFPMHTSSYLISLTSWPLELES